MKSSPPYSGLFSAIKTVTVGHGFQIPERNSKFTLSAAQQLHNTKGEFYQWKNYYLLPSL